MGGFLHFIQYHNAVPVALSIALLGAGGVFAATNPDAIYSETRTPLTVDNTYLVGKDLSSYSPKAEIIGVTEDEEYYYVAYKLYTIDLKDYVWQDIEREDVMKVSKPDLGPYRDLGLYVMEQLRQIIGSEGARLAQTQEAAQKNVSQKIVSIAYGGLIGRLFDETTETLPGYTPVVTSPPPVVAAAQSEEPSSSVAAAAGAVSAAPTSSMSAGVVLSGDPSDTEPPYLQILGSNPVMLQAGDSYLDLGAVAADNGKTEDVTLNLYLNGEKKERIYIMSAQTGEYVITYEAVDKAGNIRRETRKIIVVGVQNKPAQSAAAAAAAAVIHEVPATQSEQSTVANDTSQQSGVATSTAGSTSDSSAATSITDSTGDSSAATSTETAPADTVSASSTTPN